MTRFPILIFQSTPPQSKAGPTSTPTLGLQTAPPSPRLGLEESFIGTLPLNHETAAHNTRSLSTNASQSERLIVVCLESTLPRGVDNLLSSRK